MTEAAFKLGFAYSLIYDVLKAHEADVDFCQLIKHWLRLISEEKRDFKSMNEITSAILTVASAVYTSQADFADAQKAREQLKDLCNLG